jgi:protoporphyrinogen oxidase
MNAHVGIIGGGFLGQTLALRLLERGLRVTLLEASARLGGLADAWQVGEVVWDRHYHVTLLSDSHLRRLLAQLGLERDIQWARTRTGFYSGGRLHSLTSALDFLRFRPLRLHEKLRLAWTIHRASRIRDGLPLDDQSVERWLVRRSGRGVYEKIWLPLLKSKLGDAWQQTSAAFIWATINRLYAARRNGLAREMFGYVPGGYARVQERLAACLNEKGASVRVGCRVEEIAGVPGHMTVFTRGGQRQVFDHVVVTLPPPVAAQLCPGLAPAEARQWTRVRMLGVVCLSLVLEKPLAGYYVTNITDEGFPFTGVIEMTALVDPQSFGGRTLVYLPKYVPSDDGLFDDTDESIFERFLAGLCRMYHVKRDDVLAWRVSRARHVMAVPEVGYARRVPPVTTSVPGLSLVSSAQILNNTLNVNATIGWAETCAQRVLLAASATSHQPALLSVGRLPGVPETAT